MDGQKVIFVMKPSSIIQQLNANAVAIISLVIAVTALLYTAWREEQTERNRNLRPAALEVLKNLGELQQAINLAYYQPDNAMSNPFIGWGYMTLVGDLSQLLPPPVPETVDQLIKTWNVEWKNVKTQETSVEKLSQEINASRQAVLQMLRTLR
jgi:hypothetical protein